MRPSRLALAFSATIVAPVVAGSALLGDGSPEQAAPVGRQTVTASVAVAPAVVARGVVAPARRTPPPAAPRSTPTRTPHVAPVHRDATRTRTMAATAAPHDGYPYAAATADVPDRWGFTQRQCVSYAAWRLAEDGHPVDEAQGWGSALHWDDTAAARGVRVSRTPHVGAIAQWDAGESGRVWLQGRPGTFTAGPYGHVGYVSAVYADGTVLVEQYNALGDRSYAALRMAAPRYLF